MPANPNKFKKGGKPDAQDDFVATNEDTPALILVLDNDSGRNRNDEIVISAADTVSAIEYSRSSSQGGLMTARLWFLSLFFWVIFIQTAHAQADVRDLASNIANGTVVLVEANGNGASSGASVEGVLVNQADGELKFDVYLSAPLFFRNSGSGQNMIASQVYHGDGGYRTYGKRSFITLKPRERSPVIFVAYCWDFDKANPSAEESFSVSPAPPGLKTVMRNITNFARKNPGTDITAAAQVALWLAQGETPGEIAGRFPFTPSDERLARSFLQ